MGDPLTDYAKRAFGNGADFYLRECERPGIAWVEYPGGLKSNQVPTEFDRLFAKEFVRQQRKPSVRLNPAERRVLSRFHHRLRDLATRSDGGHR